MTSCQCACYESWQLPKNKIIYRLEIIARKTAQITCISLETTMIGTFDICNMPSVSTGRNPWVRKNKSPE